MRGEGRIQLYHCRGARSFRALWALEEVGASFTLHNLPFPPRMKAPQFLEINPLGTVPYLITEGGRGMTESSAIVDYIAERHPDAGLSVAPGDPDRPTYLNFLYMSDATLTFPQTIYLRYTLLEAAEKRQPVVAADYKRWFLSRLRNAMDMFVGEYACGEQFTGADIAIGYAVLLARTIGLEGDLPHEAREYWSRLEQRPAFRRARSAEKPAVTAGR